MEDEIRAMAQKIAGYQKVIHQLEEENTQVNAEKNDLKRQLIKYQAICRVENQIMDSEFSPATSSSEGMKMFKGLFKKDFYCLDDVDVDILNVFLQKIHALRTGLYQPSSSAIASCDEFFNFNRVLVKREYLAMLYALLDIKVTSRRFESFNREIASDEVIVMIEILFLFIEAGV
ncbi:hypothetical protein GMES_0975 [Paraglaciecola mesophila KMM 241]|uniref:Uncharacterized protein n=1 Tax=Paraglaciecola mesophila KMM 241 TaxID=1128912 RepID=K6XRN3_9ALTE|nr:hypothetical protein [Paraglaciecola mesophila]GAC23274.1 hypothetical protein GMES_0975 [Paraglaciecola mesophila KMM 241]